jgi:hypothetical protein
MFAACCDTQGLEVGVSLLGPFGAVVCRYGPDTLRPVMKATIEGLITQSPETLARLPEFTDILANADPAVMAVRGAAADPGCCCRLGWPDGHVSTEALNDTCVHMHTNIKHINTGVLQDPPGDAQGARARVWQRGLHQARRTAQGACVC